MPICLLCPSVQPKKLDAISYFNPVSFSGTPCIIFSRISRERGLLGLLVREIGRPNDPIDAHVVPHLHADAIVHNPPVDVLFEVLTG